MAKLRLLIMPDSCGPLRVKVGEDLTKNGVEADASFGDRSRDLLIHYIRVHRPHLPNSQSRFLFPGKASPERPRDMASFGQAISDTILEHTGVKMHPHAFRHLAVWLILRENPGALDDARAVLAHKTLAMVTRVYHHTTTREASERHGKTLERLRKGQPTGPGRKRRKAG